MSACPPLIPPRNYFAEEARQILARVVVYGETEWDYTFPLGFFNCHARVLQPVESLVSVKIIRFAVREQKEEPHPLRLFLQDACCVSYGGAHPSVDILRSTRNSTDMSRSFRVYVA